MIYTFYSYKGGVGRSMALANVAECFYEKGLRVLMVDWDLEAPGLESFFFEAPEWGATKDQPDGAAAVRSHLGLIDMLLSYKRMYLRLPLTAPPVADPRTEEAPTGAVAKEPVSIDAVLDEHLPPLNDFVTPIHRGSSGNALWLLSAGWRQNRFSEYSRAIQSFDWDEFYGEFSGEAYFEWMRRQFNDLADVVLIDSRTGVTEMGGVCARQLADVVVSFCAPNFQNVDGVEKMVRSFRSSELLSARKGRPIETLVIPTRIDNSELDWLGKFKEFFHTHLEAQPSIVPQIIEITERPFWDLLIPYIPKFAFLERRVIGPGVGDQDPTGQLPKAYWRLATHLAVLAPASNPVRYCFNGEIARDFPQLHSGVFVSYADDEGRRLAGPMAKILRDAGIVVDDGDAAADPSIGNAETLAIILTSPAVSSDAIRRQVRFARQSGRCIYLICSSPVAVEALPNWLRSLPFIEIGDRARLVRDLCQRCRAERVPMMAPALPKGVIRREMLLDALQTAMASGPVVALVGMAGSGKTVVAAQYCRSDEVVDAFPGGIIWLNSDQAGSVSTVHRALNDAVFGSDGDYNESTGVDRLTRRLHGARHLVVIDDAEKNRAIEAIRRLNEGGVCLILTRNADIASQFASHVIRIGVFTEEESLALITRALVPDVQQSVDHLDQQILGLAIDLGNWPAAVCRKHTSCPG